MVTGPVTAATRQWMTACAAGCLLFLGSLAASAWHVQASIEQGLGRLVAHWSWLQLPDVFEAIERLGSRAVVLPAALILWLFLPIPRLRHWWLPAAVLLGSWILGSLAAAGFGYLGLAREGAAFPDMDAVTAVAFLVIAAHLVQCSLTSRSLKLTLWSCGIVLIAFAGLDPLLFDPTHSLPLSDLAGAGLGLACAAAAAWWDEATLRLTSRRAPALVGAAAAAPADAVNGPWSSGRAEAMPLIARVIYHFYERHLLNQVQRWPAPRHVGVILDGNRRYARRRGFSDLRTVYRLGAQKLDRVLDWCAELRIPAVTLWVCSTDNLGRTSEQVSGILAAVEAKLQALAHDPQIQRQQVRVQAIGRLELLPATTVAAIRAAEAATARHAAITLTIAVAYGGREEIADAVRGLLADEARRGSKLEDVIENVTPEAIGRHLYVASLPDPELIIRTSGEIRLSGFLLWQSAYSEFYFSDVYWPAFRKIDFLRALRAFQQRKRRYGR
ncbi:MAG TPA: polyprenyl diphosphate synthase [Geminicoccaceae bacterium]|nr:polyprenyl diphosphate synthase [Geminicoccaceae bacterium]